MKQFIIIGNQNAITYKEIFPYIKNNQLWLGMSMNGGDRKFYVPNNYELNAATCGIDSEGKRFINVKGVTWFTNIYVKNAIDELDLFKKYNPTDYPKYDNYDAIEVSKTCDIPMDYNGVMGVPITFLYKYNPNQFEIIGQLNVGCFMDENGWQGSKGKNMLLVNGKNVYKRILIKKIKK